MYMQYHMHTQILQTKQNLEWLISLRLSDVPSFTFGCHPLGFGFIIYHVLSNTRSQADKIREL